MITFRVDCIPVAQPRQRHAVIAGHVRNYTPTKHPVNAFKAAVQLAAAAAYQGPPLDCPLSLVLCFVMPRPKSKTWKSKPMLREPHTGRPDTDNLSKAAKDALTGLLWRDDSLIWHESVTKEIAGGKEQPHVLVSVVEGAP